MINEKGLLHIPNIKNNTTPIMISNKKLNTIYFLLDFF